MTSPLTGVWSLENTGLRDASFEDVTLALATDGTGWVAFSRPGYSDSALLTWRASDDGTIKLSYREGREVTDGRVAASDFSNEPTRLTVPRPGRHPQNRPTDHAPPRVRSEADNRPRPEVTATPATKSG